MVINFWTYALDLWQALPERCRQNAAFHSDEWQNCKTIIHFYPFSKQIQ